MTHPRSDLHAEIATLEEQNKALAETITKLTTPEGAPTTIPGFTYSESRILYALIEAQSPLSNRDLNRVLHPTTRYFTESNTVAVFISRMRKRLADHGVTITSRYHVGYSLSPEDKAKLKELVSG